MAYASLTSVLKTALLNGGILLFRAIKLPRSQKLIACTSVVLLQICIVLSYLDTLSIKIDSF